jgi:pyridoxine 4-dehydrogenase
VSEKEEKLGGRFTLGGDLTVHRLGFGAMRVTGPGIWGDPPDRAAALRLLRRVVALGIDFIDTSDAYGPEVSENLLAEALYPYPRGLVIGTKGGLLREGPGVWTRDGRPTHLREACEGSLRRLRLQRIDVYQLHAVDDRVPLEDSVGELAKLRAEGKIRHVGLSNVSVEQLERARKLVPIVSVQNRYSLADRSGESVLDHCERQGIGFIPFFPLRAGKISSESRALRQVGEALHVSPMQVALSWLLQRSPAMIPIPGTSSEAHLEENVAAAALRLSPADFATLAKA